MKKAILIIVSSFLIFFSDCKKKSENITPAQCSSTIANEYSAAISAFAADPTNTTKCKAVFDILGKLINCPGVPEATKAQYQKEYNNSPCK